MRTSERMRALKAWVYENLCRDRMFKAPAYDARKRIDITQIVRQEPKVFLGWQPTRPEYATREESDPLAAVVPGILIMPSASYAKAPEEKRFDRYNGVHRPQELGQTLSVSILFGIYEPGIRLPGFSDESDPAALDMSKIKEGTEEGLFTLLNWMDDCVSGLLASRFIPHSDLFLSEADLVYSPYTDQNYVVDKRPLYYGFVNAKFNCYADDRNNDAIEKYLI